MTPLDKDFRVPQENMKKWRTILHHDEGMMTSRPIEIKSGIYQGDSLSPLVICLALAPLSSLLNRSGYVYNTPMGRSATSSTWMT